MKSNEFRQIEKDALEMGKKSKEEYVEKGALESLKGASRSYNLALRASITELMYNKLKNK